MSLNNDSHKKKIRHWNGLLCADVPLRNCSLTHKKKIKIITHVLTILTHTKWKQNITNYSTFWFSSSSVCVFHLRIFSASCWRRVWSDNIPVTLAQRCFSVVVTAKLRLSVISACCVTNSECRHMYISVTLLMNHITQLSHKSLIKNLKLVIVPAQPAKTARPHFFIFFQLNFFKSVKIAFKWLRV